MTADQVGVASQIIAAALTCWAAFLMWRAATPRPAPDLLERLRRQPTSWTGGGSADPDMIAMRQAVLAGSEVAASNAEQERAGRLNRSSALLAITAALVSLAGSLIG